MQILVMSKNELRHVEQDGDEPHEHHECCSVNADHRHAPFVTDKMLAPV
jgi:hypothetical protein